ncbi:hypothetical protein QOL99_15175 [Deinococcus sp. MIMF12]|uniref:Intracellular proteinase inhibitor BsuPI domain-containing protein n=1 Tax=Deinococcus rhizophilus TaxID=3049544 RepID=A0ABT7JK96_9DEIO|nr:hypothetical protein [Deinococcus rhizophilus]MDL2345481.1 hypothetical protein [Deinococcus rhizophilus]
MLKFAAIQAWVTLALLGPGVASAQSYSAPGAGVPAPIRAQNSNPFPEVEARLHEQFPEYIGFEVYGGTLYLAVNSADPAIRLRILRAVQAGHADFLRVLRAQPGQVRFLQGSAKEYLAAANKALGKVRGVTFAAPQARIERLVVGLQHHSQRDEAEAVFRAAGVPLGAVLIVTSSAARSLPTGPALNAPLEAKLQVSATIRQGQTLPITLTVRNTSQSVVTFEHGACDFHIEIRRVMTGEIVLPVPTMETCITIGYAASFQPGQTKELASYQWKVETMDWKTLPPGEYEVCASFGPVLGVVPHPPLPYLLPAPVRFKVLGS